MQDRNELEALVHHAALCVQRGFVSGTSGNVSVRIGEQIMISPTGTRLDALTPEGLTVLDANSGVVLSGAEPSKEWRIHWEIYQKRPELHTIFHLHPVDCIVAGILLWPERELPLYVPAHGIKLGRVRQVALYRAGSEELARRTALEFAAPDVTAVLLYRHGCIVGAPTEDTAYGKTEYLIEACHLHMILRGNGSLPREVLDAYRELPLKGPAEPAEKEE